MVLCQVKRNGNCWEPDLMMLGLNLCITLVKFVPCATLKKYPKTKRRITALAFDSLSTAQPPCNHSVGVIYFSFYSEQNSAIWVNCVIFSQFSASNFV